jgi:hypothetical protein
MSHTQTHEHVLDDVDSAVAVDEDETGTVRVFVSKKLPAQDVPDGQLVSQNADPGKATDVVEIGEVRFEVDLPGFGDEESLSDEVREIFESESDRHDRHRPVPSGVSEMNSTQGGAATGGPLAKVTTHDGSARWDGSADAEYVRVSNCHVYGLSGNADFGDPVTQPSPLDGGDSDDMVGSYVASVPLEDGGRVDCAARTLANGLDGESFGPHNLEGEWGRTVADKSQLSRGQTLIKSGRTTGVTEGTVQATGASVRVGYGDGRTILFRDQIITTDMSDGGDSGSDTYNADSKALTGLLFAGSDRATVLNHIEHVESELGVTMLTGMPTEEPPDEGHPDEGNGSGGSNGGSGGGSDGPTGGSPPGEHPGRGRRVARGRVENPGVGGPFGQIDLTDEANAEIAERSYHVAVEMWLNTHFGSVEHEHYFREARRFADFIVGLTPDDLETDFDESMFFAVEVENSFGSIMEAVGQASLYAGLWTLEEGHENVTPLVILPQDGVEDPELEAIRRHATVVVFPTEVEEEQSG